MWFTFSKYFCSLLTFEKKPKKVIRMDRPRIKRKTYRGKTNRRKR